MDSLPRNERSAMSSSPETATANFPLLWFHIPRGTRGAKHRHPEGTDRNESASRILLPDLAQTHDPQPGSFHTDCVWCLQNNSGRERCARAPKLKRENGRIADSERRPTVISVHLCEKHRERN